MTIYFNGEYLSKDAVRISPDDRGFLFGDGVYEATPCYAGRFLALDRHLARLQHGLSELRIGGVTAEALRPVHEELVRRNDLENSWALVYVQVTRGAARRSHAFPVPSVPPTVYGVATKVTRKYDPERGVTVITVPDLRWSRCDLKTVNILPNCLANQQAQEAGAFEAIFVRDGAVLEGTHTGLFAVLEGVACTSPVSQFMLPSVTRDLVLELCARHGIPARETPLPLERFRQAEEIFLVGTTSEVLPVVAVDGRPIGAGAPGAITRRLQSLFRQMVDGQADRRIGAQTGGPQL